jgi:hypothetical protein
LNFLLREVFFVGVLLLLLLLLLLLTILEAEARDDGVDPKQVRLVIELAKNGKFHTIQNMLKDGSIEFEVEMKIHQSTTSLTAAIQRAWDLRHKALILAIDWQKRHESLAETGKKPLPAPIGINDIITFYATGKDSANRPNPKTRFATGDFLKTPS